MEPLTAIGGILLGAVAWLYRGDVVRAVKHDIDYPIAPNQPRAPGLPSSARKMSIAGAAREHVRAAGARSVSPAFGDALVRLAQNESGCTFARPANTFNNTEEARAASRAITAWGVFQYNAPAWRRASLRPGAMPWQCTAREEIEIPIAAEYAPIWKRAKALGAPDAYAERAIRLHHMLPSFVGPLFKRSRTMGWRAAWLATPVYHNPRTGRTTDARATIDGKLGEAP